MIKNYLIALCDLLDINMPSVSYDTSKFNSKTMMSMAEINEKGSKIYLMKKSNPDPDYLFAIAHEMRHIWQAKTNMDLYLSNYKTANQFSSVNEYNLQLAEVDANAFAAIVMINMFGVKPTWNNLSDKVIATVEQQMNSMIDEINSNFS